LTLFVSATCLHSTKAQTPASQTDNATANDLKKLNELVEQNVKLEKQNRELMAPVSSTFGFYTGGLKGVSLTLGATALF
jgi:hypothetical protein